MDVNHPQNIDPRPKRRRMQDNPYELFTVGRHTENPRYYLRVKDAQGTVCMEIQQELYELLNRFELDDLSFLNEVEFHYEHSELTEASLTVRAAEYQAPLEEMVYAKMEVQNLHTAITQLPEIQRRRLQMYYFEELTYQQIAEREHCSHPAIIKSISSAVRKLRELIGNSEN